jgi:hypothetical protein
MLRHQMLSRLLLFSCLHRFFQKVFYLAISEVYRAILFHEGIRYSDCKWKLQRKEKKTGLKTKKAPKRHFPLR